MRPGWPSWKKILQSATLPQVIRLLNQRFDSLSQWVTGSIPSEPAISIPTQGHFVLGYYVENAAPAVLGGAGNRYIVKGWKRLTTGNAHALNVDWVECRTLTGT